MNEEPYECLPEGEPHAATNYITRLLAGLLIALIVLIASACPAKASENDWCKSWQDGYEASFYLVCRTCQTIEPKECPEPEPTDSSGYMRGVKDGAADGKQKQREWI
jgi:hypothetical protein